MNVEHDEAALKGLIDHGPSGTLEEQIDDFARDVARKYFEHMNRWIPIDTQEPTKNALIAAKVFHGEKGDVIYITAKWNGEYMISEQYTGLKYPIAEVIGWTGLPNG